jgi:very-short-patch-repair endonuclease
LFGLELCSSPVRKFKSAVEINDLYDDSPLEDTVWQQLKKYKIKAERQELVSVKQKQYFLDFAIYCVQGNIDVETDGDTWHADKKRIPIDNLRDNNLHQRGWYTLRFNTYHVKEEMAEYCIPTIVETINRLGGLGQEGQLVLSLPNPPTADGFQQLNLFQL